MLEDEKSILEKFLNFDMASASEVFAEFVNLRGAVHDGPENFVYVPGSREDRVLLVAHADTVFSFFEGPHKVIFEDGIYSSGEFDAGIGADDRAGCAMLYLLKDLGHSLLITNDEENGSLGAQAIRDEHPELFKELNSHQYMLEFDRRNGGEYKVYDIPVTEEFKAFIETSTGYIIPNSASSTDIKVLCSEICGANLSVGYQNEHNVNEILVYDDWKRTLDIARKMLDGKQEKFLLFN